MLNNNPQLPLKTYLPKTLMNTFTFTTADTFKPETATISTTIPIMGGLQSILNNEINPCGQTSEELDVDTEDVLMLNDDDFEIDHRLLNYN